MNLEIALLEALWITRWNESGTTLTSVLTEEEARKICERILIELDKAGYCIVEKHRNINLDLMEKQLDEAIQSETKVTLMQFLNQQRKND